MSRTTQRLIGGKIEKVWAGVTAFLATCTTASIHEPTSVDLTAYSAWQDDEQPVIANRIIAETKAIFGHVEGVPVSFHYPSGIPSLFVRWPAVAQICSWSGGVNCYIRFQTGTANNKY
ncbi:MAG: hypothetical protein IPO87_06755 [Flavobacteriales bacterium]|nr:hypothetical protein [Flavobacteriales bacterium]